MSLKDGNRADGKPDEGLVEGQPIPDELLKEMTDEQRHLVMTGQMGDDLKVFESPLGGLSVVAIRAGEPVCQYCMRRFVETEHEGKSIEIFPRDPVTGETGSTRIKVHGVCHDKANPL
jgi:hypothetical protein